MTAEEMRYVRGEVDLPPQYCDKCIKEEEAC